MPGRGRAKGKAVRAVARKRKPGKAVRKKLTRKKPVRKKRSPKAIAASRKRAKARRKKKPGRTLRGQQMQGRKRKPAKKKKKVAKKRKTAKRKTTKRKTAKRKTAKRKTATKRKKSTRTQADRRRAALLGIRRKKAKKSRRGKMAKRPVSKKRRYRRKPKRTRKYIGPRARKGRKRKPIGSYRGKRRRTRSGKTRGGRWARGRMRKRTYSNVTRRKRKTRRAAAHRQKYYVRKNPINALKGMVKEGMFTFAGILGVRALSKVIEDKLITGSATFAPGTTLGKIAPVLPSAIAMLLAALSPKVIKGQPALVKGLQNGATLVFFDAVLEAVLKVADPGKKVSGYLLPGMSGYGYGGYSEYVASPMGGMGLEVESAMALDEYVAAPSHQLGMGGDFDVEEALAGNEGQAFETGYAGGTLAKTVFSNY